MNGGGDDDKDHHDHCHDHDMMMTMMIMVMMMIMMMMMSGQADVDFSLELKWWILSDHKTQLAAALTEKGIWQYDTFGEFGEVHSSQKIYDLSVSSSVGRPNLRIS